VSALVQIRPRPSASHQWAGGGCTGSPEWRAKWERESGAAAKDGNRLHDIAAAFLGPDEATCSREDYDVVGPYIVDVRKAMKAAGPRAELRVEQRTEVVDERRLGGTPDAVLVDIEARHVIIWDLKTGWGLVEVKGNWQLLCYALMVLSNLGAGGWTVELRIVQPRPYHPAGPVRSWSPSAETMSDKFATIRKRFAEALWPGQAKLVTGAHCRYCDAITVCPSARSLSLHVVEWSDTEAHELPDDVLARELHVLRGAELALKNRIAGIEATITAKLEKGTPVPFASVERGVGRSQWVDEQAAINMLKVFGGKDYSRYSLPTPKQVIKAGASPELVATLSTQGAGKPKVVIDLEGERVANLLGDLPDLTHTQPKPK